MDKALEQLLQDVWALNVERVAARAGVSPATVRALLRDPYARRLGTVLAVEQAVREEKKSND